MPRTTFAWVLAAFATVVSLWLAVDAGLLAGFDRTLLLRLSPSGPWLALAVGATWLGDTARRVLVAVLAAGVLLGRRQPRAAAILIAAVGAGAALNSMVKALAARPRPQLLPHLDAVTSFSFPSGHAANTTILYLSLAMLMPARHRAAALAAAALLTLAVGLSRVMLAVHWPSDVLAGWLLGLGWVLLWRPLLVAVGRPAVDRR